MGLSPMLSHAIHNTMAQSAYMIGVGIEMAIELAICSMPTSPSVLNIVRNLADTATFSDSLSVSVPVAPDHIPMIVCYTISVNC